MNRLTFRVATLSTIVSVCTLNVPTAFARRGEPERTPVTLSSDPAGASVTINRRPVGTTPVATTLEPGRHLVQLERHNFEPVYRTLAVGATTVIENIRLTPVTAGVLVVSEPPNATVTQDGATIGVTPLLMPEVPIGRYRMDFSLSGYRPQQHELTVSGSNPQRLNVRLTRSSATLSVTSTPSGAAVSVNGIHRGATPIDVDRIQEGQGFLEVSADGYAPYREQIQLAAGEVFSVHVPLQALPSQLTIRSIPPGGRVYVDNQFQGETPHVMDNLSAGDYRIRVELDGHEILARTVALGHNRQLTEEFRLTANVGGIRIVTAPAEVALFVDGREVGQTVAADDATDQISAPLDITGLPVGTVEVVFQRPGYAEQKRTLTISRNEVAVIETVRLERLFIPDVEVQTQIGTYRGVYVSRNNDFYRIETAPGLTRSFPVKDIVRIRLIRDGNVVDDLSD